jgi:20S proteasome subunit alpha 2
MADSAYSFSLTTFSRTGKLLQIEYALNAVANGRTSLGICAKDGVVIATDKKLASSLVDSDDVSKVENITEGCGFVYSGVGPDYRVLGELLLHLWFHTVTHRRLIWLQKNDTQCS